MPSDRTALGWKPFFQQQLTLDELTDTYPARLAELHRSRCVAWSERGEHTIELGLFADPQDLAVGDWILLAADHPRPLRVLQRHSLLTRKAPGSKVAVQRIAANIDTLFIVSACNQDFSEARIERYLALALEAGIMPLVVLTRADECDDPDAYRRQAARLHSGLLVECLDARQTDQLHGLRACCGRGQTVALVGSSGVGKSTLTNGLSGSAQRTSAIRATDAKGRHTTTARSMHWLEDGGLLIDTPGMRELQLTPCEQGVEDLFEDVSHYLGRCRFSDCRHQSEPGCAILAALDSGALEWRRWHSYQKLQAEQARNGESLAQRRQRDRALGQLYKTVQGAARQRKGK